MGFARPEKPAEQPPLNIKTERTATNFQVRPWPVIWGTHRLGGTFLEGIWEYRTEAVTERVKTGKSSSSNITKAINYFGNIAQGVCFGKLHKITSIIKDDKEIWSGSLETNGAAYHSITIEDENAPMILYTGLQDQGTVRGGGLTDSSLPDGHPPYKELIYFLFEDLFFGEQSGPPNFEIIIEVVHKALVLDESNTTGDAENDDVELHRVDSGQLIPEVIYSAMTNPIFGGSAKPEDFEAESWVNACNVLRTEGLGYSPWLNSPKKIDGFVKDLLNIANAEIIDRNGKLAFVLKRSTDSVITVPESAFLKDPRIEPSSWDDGQVFNEIRVPYSLLSRDLEPLNTVQSDDSSRSIVGVKSKSFSYDGFRSELAAAQMANRFVKALACPKVSCTLELDRTMKSIKKGALIAPVFPDKAMDGQTYLRVLEKTEAEPAKGGVTLKCEVDKTFIEAAELGDTDAEVVYGESEPQEISGHLTYIPTSQKDNFADGAIIALSRQSNADDRAIVSMGWDGVSYDAILAAIAFPLRINISEWRDFGSGLFNVRFTFNHDHEESDFLNSITDSLPDWQLLTQDDSGATSWSVIRAGSALQAIGGGVYEVSFVSGQFETSLFSNVGRQPRSVAYIGPVEGFSFYRTNQRFIERSGGNATGDTDQIRRFKIQSSTRGNQQDFENGFDIEHNKTQIDYSPSWGDVVSLGTGYSFAALDTTGIAPLTPAITINGGNDYIYSIEWNDGTIDDLGSGTPNQTFNHTFSTAGIYDVTISLEDAVTGELQGLSVQVTVT